MGYCTQADLELRFGKKRITVLLTDDADESITPEQKFNVALTDADSKIDSYLRTRRKNLPIAAPPEEIVNVCVDIVMYYLHRGRDYADIPEWAAKRYDDSIDWLERFAAGKVDIDVPDDVDDEADDSIIAIDQQAPHFSKTSY